MNSQNTKNENSDDIAASKGRCAGVETSTGSNKCETGLLPVIRQRSLSTPELDDVDSSRRTTLSCQALRHALLTLYRIDDFIMEEIGSGFFSQVYKVTHMVTGEVMVLKINTLEENRPNVLREVQLMNRMSHPNILKFLGVCVNKGQLHALSEYINGGSLHEILSNAAEVLPWQERVSMSLDIAEGMKYLHSCGVFHRDLTSRNILVSIDGTVKKAIVGDFGLAAKIPDIEADEFHLSTVGSPFWIAPECINNQRYDQRSDIFSFGIVLCEIIARIDANPDVMPRTQNFGLDYIAYSSLAEDCPLHFLYLAFCCCQMDPSKRPPFTELVEKLKTIKNHRLVSQHTNPIAVKSQISVGHVRRHIYKFSGNDALHKRSKSAGQILDFLSTEVNPSASATAQYIGEHMTKEDPFYTPCPANTNPFQTVDHMKEGKKLLAADQEVELTLDTSLTLPIVPHYGQTVAKQSFSLPEKTNLLRNAITQFNYQIISSRQEHDKKHSYSLTTDDDDMSIDSAVDISNAKCNKTFLKNQGVQNSSLYNKQLNLECAMLFCGLDLIQLQKSKCDTNPTSDLESEFQDDLEDVLRSCSSSESWVTPEDIALSPSCSMNEPEHEWWKHIDKSDPANKHFHPTLVEKRRQLRRVEVKEKIEQLQQKLDQLRIQTKKRTKSKYL